MAKRVVLNCSRCDDVSLVQVVSPGRTEITVRARSAVFREGANTIEIKCASCSTVLGLVTIKAAKGCRTPTRAAPRDDTWEAANPRAPAS